MSKLILKNGPIATAIKEIEIRCLRFDGTNVITTILDVNLTKKQELAIKIFKVKS